MLTITIDDRIPFVKGVFEPYAKVQYISGGAISREYLRHTNVLLIRTRTRCDKALLEGTPVRMICTATIGFDHIDMDYCRDQGIEVVTAQGCNAGGVAQWVMAVIAASGKNPQHHTLGIVGVGHVGSALRSIARQLGFRVVCNDPFKQGCYPHEIFVSLDELLQQSDIVTLHVPLSFGGAYPTANLAGASFFDMLREGALFLNSSRGEVVDETSLLMAIKQKKIIAGLDVWRNEPFIDSLLLENTFLSTAHIAGYSLQGKANGSGMVVQAIAHRYDLEHLKTWYPSGVSRPASYKQVLWDRFLPAIASAYDIVSESCFLKTHPLQFEDIRNNYSYRNEFF